MNCCICGNEIEFENPSYRCISCAKKETLKECDPPFLTEFRLVRCRHCDRFQRGKNNWTHVFTNELVDGVPKSKQLATPEILEFCVGRLQKLKGLVLVAADFAETTKVAEDLVTEKVASERLCGKPRKPGADKEILLTISYVHPKLAELFGSNRRVALSTLVVFALQHSVCADCVRAFTPTSLGSVLQVRQRPAARHKKTLLNLEQLLSARLVDSKKQKGASLLVESVVPQKEGFDVVFADRRAAARAAGFVRQVAPVLSEKKSNKLVTADVNNNIEKRKETVCVELVPVNRGDLVFLDKTFLRQQGCATRLSGAGALALVTKVGAQLWLWESSVGEFSVRAKEFQRTPFASFMDRDELVTFEVLAVDLLAEGLLTVVRDNQTGRQTETKTALTHLKTGDQVRGFDVRGKLCTGALEDFLAVYTGQQVFLVEKVRVRVRQKKAVEQVPPVAHLSI